MFQISSRKLGLDQAVLRGIEEGSDVSEPISNNSHVILSTNYI